VSKNLIRFRSENNFVESSNDYIESSSIRSNVAKSFDILTTSLSVLYNHFDDLTKLS